MVEGLLYLYFFYPLTIFKYYLRKQFVLVRVIDHNPDYYHMALQGVKGWKPLHLADNKSEF